eukprot:TRINITY_DN13599_c0_g1_i1.p1 TRINITY_DN13599_c0_g1~~TRINITY_DN13599_c0_g1_i1.p1  ORF type:complete len:129 (-),score=1.43 TRINITY_DN13599_c0_g1_i1:62-448(-)
MVFRAMHQQPPVNPIFCGPHFAVMLGIVRNHKPQNPHDFVKGILLPSRSPGYFCFLRRRHLKPIRTRKSSNFNPTNLATSQFQCLRLLFDSTTITRNPRLANLNTMYSTQERHRFATVRCFIVMLQLT